MSPDTPNPVPPHDPVSADEARVLAVLLGEASPYEREAVEELLSRRPDLRAYRERVAELLGLLPGAVTPAGSTGPALRLDDARRAALLEKLREPTVVGESAFVSEKQERKNILRFLRFPVAYAPGIAAAVALLLVLGGLLVPGVMSPKRLSREVAARHESEMDDKDARLAATESVDGVRRANAFAGGFGGAASEERFKSLEQKASAREIDGRSVDRIVSKSASDSISLPAAPVAKPAPVPTAAPAPVLTGDLVGRDADESRDVTKSGEGRLTLSGAATYTGATTVTAGTLSFRDGGVEGKDIAGAPEEAANGKPRESLGFASGLDAGGMSRGGAGGSGGGEGTGIGIGKGGGRNFVSTFGTAVAGDSRRDASDEGEKASVNYGAPVDAPSARLEAPFGYAVFANPKSESVAKESRQAEALAEESRKSKLLALADKNRAISEELAKANKQSEDAALAAKKPAAPVVAQTETQAAENAFSTFSLNVGDVSFRLAAEAVKRGAYPDIQNIRTEEFVNAQRFRDPAPRADEPVALRQEQARHPFAHNRNLVRLSLVTNSEGRAAQQPLSLVVLLDNSGSMERADRRETVAAAENTLADNLRPGDKVSVIGFARDTRLLVDRMDGANTKPLRELVKNASAPEGGTNMELALNAAYAQLARQTPAGAQGRVVLLTDGAANLGDADPARLAALVSANARSGRALDAYGVGLDGYNDDLLEQLSRKGYGRYAFLNNADDAGAELGKKLAGALRPFASDVKVQVEFNPARVNSWRLIGYDNHRLRQQDFRDNTVRAAELAAAEAGTALYTFEPNPDGVGDVGVVRVRYRVPGTQDYREREWAIPYTTPPAFADAPEGVRLAGCAAFVAETLAKNPNAAVNDRAELRKQISRLSASRPGDRPLADLRAIAGKLGD